MHVKIKNKTAVIEFENNSDSAGHVDVMKEIIRLLDDGFKKFVFDFEHVSISFNSGISGFLVATSKKIVEAGAIVEIANLSDPDKDLLKAVGFDTLGVVYRRKES
jgi:anti-anti-sigma regulatory factor